MKQRQIEDKICEILTGYSNAKIIKASDYSEQRQDNMIVVSIQNVQHVYPTLPDYRYEVKILIDSLIADDLQAVQFHKICQFVQQKMNQYVFKQKQLSEAFGQIPVVGILYNSSDISITGQSNQMNLNYDIFASF